MRTLKIAVLSLAMAALVSVGSLAASDLPDAHGANGENFKIGYVPTTTGQPLTIAWGKGIRRVTDEYPNITVVDFDGDMKAETQVAIIQDLISQQFDAIILQPVDQAALTGVVVEAEQEGIPVITLNNQLMDKWSAVVQVADVEAGYKVAEVMGNQIGGKGNVAVIQSPPGAFTGVNREKGFRQGIAEMWPDITIVGAQNGEWKKDKAIAVMNSLMQANPQLDGVFAVNDIMALGAMVAAESAGRLDKVKIWGMNGDGAALEAVEQGKLAGSIYCDPYAQGGAAATIALHLLTSGEGPAKGPRAGVLKVPPFAATIETVGQIGPDRRF